MSPEQELMQAAAFGVEAEAFLNTDLGRYMVKRAEEEAEAAMAELKAADPCDPENIRNLQARIWRAESFQAWIAEVMQDGWHAEGQLKAMEADD